MTDRSLGGITGWGVIDWRKADLFLQVSADGLQVDACSDPQRAQDGRIADTGQLQERRTLKTRGELGVFRNGLYFDVP